MWHLKELKFLSPMKNGGVPQNALVTQSTKQTEPTCYNYTLGGMLKVKYCIGCEWYHVDCVGLKSVPGKYYDLYEI